MPNTALVNTIVCDHPLHTPVRHQEGSPIGTLIEIKFVLESAVVEVHVVVEQFSRVCGVDHTVGRIVYENPVFRVVVLEEEFFRVGFGVVQDLVHVHRVPLDLGQQTVVFRLAEVDCYQVVELQLPILRIKVLEHDIAQVLAVCSVMPESD